MNNQLMETIRKRSSARAYTGEKVTRQELDAILEAGLQAPTATNRQEIHFSVVSGDNPVLDELNCEHLRLRGMPGNAHNFYYEAPVLIFLSAEDGFKWSKVDAGIAVSGMTLAAESLGLGTLIIGCIHDVLCGERREYFSRKLRIPDGYSFRIALAVGHKADNKTPHTYDYDKQVSIITF